MNRKVYRGSCDLGEGIFARESLRAREPLFFLTGKYMTAQEILKLEEEGANVIQVDDDGYIDPRFPGAFINHSCAPNVGINDDLSFVALRDIDPGEELRFDYSTTMLERNWTMACRCGLDECREIITDFDLLPPEIQQRYIDLGVVQPFILDHVFGTTTERVTAAA